MEERDGSDAVTNQYTYGNRLDEVWTLDNRRNSGTVATLNDHTGVLRHFYLSNTLFHVYGLMNEGSSTTPGTLREAYQYDAYGKQTVITDGNDADAIVNFSANDVRTVGAASSINGSPYMYTGQRFDAETGLMYFKNRYFSQELGRFLQRDPMGDSVGPNLYEYVQSMATRWIDQLGLQDLSADEIDRITKLAESKSDTYLKYGPELASKLHKRWREGGGDYKLTKEEIEKIVGTDQAKKAMSDLEALLRSRLCSLPPGKVSGTIKDAVATYPKPLLNAWDTEADLFFSFHNLYIDLKYDGEVTKTPDGCKATFKGNLSFRIHDFYNFVNRDWTAIPGDDTATDYIFWVWQKYGKPRPFNSEGWYTRMGKVTFEEVCSPCTGCTAPPKPGGTEGYPGYGGYGYPGYGGYSR